MHHQKPPQFESILNFRDVCTFINNDTNTKRLKEGLFFRSARPDAATPSDLTLLLQTFKLRTIIDLRTTSEQNLHPSPPIPSITTLPINLNGWPYTLHLLKQLPYLSSLHLLFLFATGNRIPAIAILGRGVLSARGLTGLATDSLDHSTAEIAAVFAVLGDRGNYPLCVHCTQGKDRTGLIVLLVMLLLGVGRGEAQREYESSEQALEKEREERLVEIRAIGLGDEFAGCGADWVEDVSAHLEERYGGVEAYLEGACRVGRDVQGRVREILLAE